jgi:hypothetical protein
VQPAQQSESFETENAAFHGKARLRRSDLLACSQSPFIQIVMYAMYSIRAPPRDLSSSNNAKDAIFFFRHLYPIAFPDLAPDTS